jgi:hypothetical protein
MSIRDYSIDECERVGTPLVANSVAKMVGGVVVYVC